MPPAAPPRPATPAAPPTPPAAPPRPPAAPATPPAPPRPAAPPAPPPRPAAPPLPIVPAVAPAAPAAPAAPPEPPATIESLDPSRRRRASDASLGGGAVAPLPEPQPATHNRKAQRYTRVGTIGRWYRKIGAQMTSPMLTRWTLRTVGSLLACLTMGVALDACSSSSPSGTVRDAQPSPDATPCSLGGSFHVTLAPTADSPAACACTRCSYDVAGGHVTDSLSLASSNVEYFLRPLLTPDAGAPLDYSCDSTETSACTFEGNCLSSFMFTVTNGTASGTQSIAIHGADGGAVLKCTYDVTASPCAPAGSAICSF